MPQILQPGDVPAWAPEDAANQIAEIFANETWPELWPRLVYTFADTAARTAALAGLGPDDRAFAMIEDINVLTRWTGTAWVLASPWIQRGTQAIAAIAAGGSLTVTVNFPKNFGTADYDPKVETTSGRLSKAVTARGNGSMTVVLDNFTGASSSAGTLFWSATRSQ